MVRWHLGAWFMSCYVMPSTRPYPDNNNSMIVGSVPLLLLLTIQCRTFQVPFISDISPEKLQCSQEKYFKLPCEL